MEEDILAENCNLEGNVKLLGHLRDFSGKVIDKTRGVAEALQGLEGATEESEVGLHSTVNEFLMLANRQFFENRVYDDDDDVVEGRLRHEVPSSHPTNGGKGIESSSKTEEASLAKYKEAVALGMESLRFFSHEEEEQEGEGAPVDIYNSRPLPFLIGAKDFVESDDVGLGGSLLLQQQESLYPSHLDEHQEPQQHSVIGDPSAAGIERGFDFHPPHDIDQESIISQMTNESRGLSDSFLVSPPSAVVPAVSQGGGGGMQDALRAAIRARAVEENQDQNVEQHASVSTMPFSPGPGHEHEKLHRTSISGASVLGGSDAGSVRQEQEQEDEENLFDRDDPFGLFGVKTSKKASPGGGVVVGRQQSSNSLSLSTSDQLAHLFGNTEETTSFLPRPPAAIIQKPQPETDSALPSTSESRQAVASAPASSVRKSLANLFDDDDENGGSLFGRSTPVKVKPALLGPSILSSKPQQRHSRSKGLFDDDDEDDGSIANTHVAKKQEVVTHEIIQQQSAPEPSPKRSPIVKRGLFDDDDDDAHIDKAKGQKDKFEYCVGSVGKIVVPVLPSRNADQGDALFRGEDGQGTKKAKEMEEKEYVSKLSFRSGSAFPVPKPDQESALFGGEDRQKKEKAEDKMKKETEEGKEHASKLFSSISSIFDTLASKPPAPLRKPEASLPVAGDESKTQALFKKVESSPPIAADKANRRASPSLFGDDGDLFGFSLAKPMAPKTSSSAAFLGASKQASPQGESGKIATHASPVGGAGVSNNTTTTSTIKSKLGGLFDDGDDENSLFGSFKAFSTRKQVTTSVRKATLGLYVEENEEKPDDYDMFALKKGSSPPPKPTHDDIFPSSKTPLPPPPVSPSVSPEDQRVNKSSSSFLRSPETARRTTLDASPLYAGVRMASPASNVEEKGDKRDAIPITPVEDAALPEKHEEHVVRASPVQAGRASTNLLFSSEHSPISSSLHPTVIAPTPPSDTEKGGSKDSNDGADNHSLQNHTPKANSAKEKEEESWKGVSLANEPVRLIHGNMPSLQPVAQGRIPASQKEKEDVGGENAGAIDNTAALSRATLPHRNKRRIASRQRSTLLNEVVEGEENQQQQEKLQIDFPPQVPPPAVEEKPQKNAEGTTAAEQSDHSWATSPPPPFPSFPSSVSSKEDVVKSPPIPKSIGGSFSQTVVEPEASSVVMEEVEDWGPFAIPTGTTPTATSPPPSKQPKQQQHEVAQQPLQSVFESGDANVSIYKKAEVPSSAASSSMFTGHIDSIQKQQQISVASRGLFDDGDTVNRNSSDVDMLSASGSKKKTPARAPSSLFEDTDDDESFLSTKKQGGSKKGKALFDSDDLFS